ncbi:MAG: hypothetical protein Q9216_000797 [Gyalolechia sp. 2 TL-2023]
MQHNILTPDASVVLESAVQVSRSNLYLSYHLKIFAMFLIIWLLASASFSCSLAFYAPLAYNLSAVAHGSIVRRHEPTTGHGDLPPNEKPHPNALDKVEGAFHDALELAAAALADLKRHDNTIFLHYFAKRDKAKVRRVYEAILGTKDVPENPTTGNELLGKLHVQQYDPEEFCTDDTLAYTHGQDTDTPYIVLCPNVFKKKGVTLLNGAPNPATNKKNANFYISCDVLGKNGHVSWMMNSMGATLLHEYTHVSFPLVLKGAEV